MTFKNGKKKAEELVSLLAKHQGEDFKMETVSKSIYYLKFKALNFT